MVQAKLRWRRHRRLLLQIYNQIVRFFGSNGQWRRRSRRYQRLAKWLGLLTIVVAMLWWNWQLLLATSAGIAIMLLVYFGQQGDWQKRWSDLGKLFAGANRQLAVAVGSGAFATLATYMAVSVWRDSNSAWIAAGAICQGLGTLAIIIILLGQSSLSPHPTSGLMTDLERVIEQLTDIHPLRRLIAVRQLTRQFATTQWERDRRIIADCLGLMLARETEPAVKNAAIEGLQVMGKVEKNTSQTPTISIPIDLKPSEHVQTPSESSLAEKFSLLSDKPR